MGDRTVAQFGRLDAAFNNAEVHGPDRPDRRRHLRGLDRVIGVNLRGVWSCMKHELRQMERHGSGAIVNHGRSGSQPSTEGPARQRAIPGWIKGRIKGNNHRVWFIRREY
jgi:NAD(P)-dependent dehydrogenase (short-subunit alcohol dehydrogenase family)